MYGGYTERNYTPLSNLVKIPDELDPIMVTTLACPGPTAIHAFRLAEQAGISMENINVAVVKGLGAVGCLSVMYLKASGVKKVYAITAGNNNERESISSVFEEYKTKDGGGIYVAMAANINNISAGKIIGATPDGRHAGKPLFDAVSQTYGMDVKGPTGVLLSVTKPSYEKVACGTVVNQKFLPAVFKNADKRKKLLHLIRVYFNRGGQEIRINVTSADNLKVAMINPKGYENLVVHVSGFSAFYVTLDPDVQKDILQRTEQNL